jgi:hypothetical protein
MWQKWPESAGVPEQGCSRPARALVKRENMRRGTPEQRNPTRPKWAGMSPDARWHRSRRSQRKAGGEGSEDRLPRRSGRGSGGVLPSRECEERRIVVALVQEQAQCHATAAEYVVSCGREQEGERRKCAHQKGGGVPTWVAADAYSAGRAAGCGARGRRIRPLAVDVTICWTARPRSRQPCRRACVRRRSSDP